jgi:hypothetical protein
MSRPDLNSIEYPAELADLAARLAAGDAHVVGDLPHASRTMLILFGGIAGGVSMPPFEFFRLTAGYSVKRIFLRDPLRAWYQRGLPGVGPSPTAVADYLRGLIADHPVDRIVIAGASAGGFAAILFGCLLEVDAVLAFSPQTFIDAANRRRTGDDRWSDLIDRLHVELGSAGTHYDLRELLRRAPVRTQFNLHFAPDDELDRVHVDHLATLPNIFLHAHPGGGHQLVKRLRNSGELKQMLNQALALSDPSGAV